MNLTKTNRVSLKLLIPSIFLGIISFSHAELDPETAQLIAQINTGTGIDYHRASWAPIHFPPAINKASNADCLQCHQEVLQSQPREASIAGVSSSEVLAWYQTLGTYQGDQGTFHQRHLSGPLATELMEMQCITCHQSNDPREETAGSSADGPTAIVQRKMVDPNICLMCHGQFPWKVMTGLSGPWSESGEMFANNCMACHVAFRTQRHQVNFLRTEAIETAGMADGDSCYGCHGGRAWYRISYPYPRHEWPGIAEEVPEWAKDRPNDSEPRFLVERNQDNQ